MDYPIQEYRTEAIQAHYFSFKSPVKVFYDTMPGDFCFLKNNKQTKPLVGALKLIYSL